MRSLRLTVALTGISNAGRSQNEERSWIVFDKEFIFMELDIVIDELMSPMKATKRDLLGPLTSFFTKRTDNKIDSEDANDDCDNNDPNNSTQ